MRGAYNALHCANQFSAFRFAQPSPKPGSMGIVATSASEEYNYETDGKFRPRNSCLVIEDHVVPIEYVSSWSLDRRAES
jgi:hypothetical protein